jgi:hypothetical protein
MISVIHAGYQPLFYLSMPVVKRVIRGVHTQKQRKGNESEAYNYVPQSMDGKKDARNTCSRCNRGPGLTLPPQQCCLIRE